MSEEKITPLNKARKNPGANAKSLEKGFEKLFSCDITPVSKKSQGIFSVSDFQHCLCKRTLIATEIPICLESLKKNPSITIEGGIFDNPLKHVFTWGLCCKEKTVSSMEPKHTYILCYRAAEKWIGHAVVTYSSTESKIVVNAIDDVVNRALYEMKETTPRIMNKNLLDMIREHNTTIKEEREEREEKEKQENEVKRPRIQNGEELIGMKELKTDSEQVNKSNSTLDTSVQDGKTLYVLNNDKFVAFAIILSTGILLDTRNGKKYSLTEKTDC